MEPGLTPEQQRAVEEFKRLRGVEPFGPFVDLLASPELMTRVGALGEYLRYRSALPPRLSEFAILVTAAQLAAAIRVGDPRADRAEGGHPANRWTRCGRASSRRASRSRSEGASTISAPSSTAIVASSPQRERAHRALGEQGTIDAIGICGYYALLAMVLNSPTDPHLNCAWRASAPARRPDAVCSGGSEFRREPGHPCLQSRGHGSVPASRSLTGNIDGRSHRCRRDHRFARRNERPEEKWRSAKSAQARGGVRPGNIYC